MLGSCPRLLLILAPLAVLHAPAARGAEEAESRPPTPLREDYLNRYGEFAEIITQIEVNFAEPIERERLFRAAIRGMLQELDPYSTYLPPERYEQLKQLAETTKPTTGVEFAIEDGRLVVLGVRAGSPAEAAGVRAGERVLTINGLPTKQMTLAQADDLSQGEGAAVTLELGESPDAARSVELQAKRLAAPTVVGVRLAQPAVGYARIASFNGNTASELRAALAGLESQGARSLVIDLRFNPGGLLEAAVDTADLLLESGEIVSVVSRQSTPRVLSASPGDVAQGKPVAVLINRYSASASEVVAAALQDHGRATLVGERTFGKGSVQSLVPIGKGESGLKLTTATYRRPSGKNIHRFADAEPSDPWGVFPDERGELTLSADEAKQLVASWGNESETPPADRQLELATRLLSESEN